MKNKSWLLLIILGISLIGLIIAIRTVDGVTPNIYFQDQTLSKGTIIYVENSSFVNNLTQQVYLDDLATQRRLENRNLTRIQWLTSIGTPIEYNYHLSPMDTNAFNRTQFYFIAKYTGTPKWINLSFEITTLNNGTTFNRTVSVNSNGTKYILNEGEFCKASYRYQVISLQSGFTRFHIQLYQPRWGVISKLDNTYYVRNAGFSFYENWGAMNKQISIDDNIVFNLSSTFDYDIFNINGQNNITFKNCSIYVYDRSNLLSKSQYIIQNGVFVNISNCYFYTSKINKFTEFYNTKMRITSSLFYGISIFGGNCSFINDSIFTNYGNSVGYGYFKIYNGVGFNNVLFKNSRYGFFPYATPHNYNITNAVFKNITYIMFPNIATQIIHFINCTSNSWLIDDSYIFGQFVDPGKAYRSYTFELRAMNNTLPVSSANVKIYNKANTLIYSGTTNSNGYIPKQTLDYCIWNSTYQVTPYIYSPYRINITKTGYRSINYNVNNSVKLNLTIPMSINTTTPITLYQNPINSTGTHVYSLTSTGYKVYANYTGYNTLIFLNHYINSTGTHQVKWMGTYWIIYDNNTGNTTPAFLYNNFINSTGTHIKQLRNTGWFIWANVTGNKTVCPVQNSTNITLFENIFNATGTHQAYYNSTIGWFVYANYTGNITIVPLNNFTVGLNFTGLKGYISWTGYYTINQTNISFNVSSNMSLNGSVNVNEDDYFLSGILTFENSQFFLMLLIGLWLFFVSEYVKYKETMLAWIQLIFAFPVTLFLSSIAYFNSIPLILPVIFIIPILGIYLVADAIYYSKKPKNKK